MLLYDIRTGTTSWAARGELLLTKCDKNGSVEQVPSAAGLTWVASASGGVPGLAGTH